jgi:hypothetical protein
VELSNTNVARTVQLCCHGFDAHENLALHLGLGRSLRRYHHGLRFGQFEFGQLEFERFEFGRFEFGRFEFGRFEFGQLRLGQFNRKRLARGSSGKHNIHLPVR